MAETSSLEIDPDHLIGKLNQLEKEAEGDLARIIELLLLENHVLQLDQSSGFRRGTHFGFSEYPRFLKFDAPADVADADEPDQEDEGGDLAQ